MLVQTEGIVINFIKYRETSIITKIYTLELGLKSCILNGIRSSKNNKIALFEPLSLLDLVLYHRDNGSISRISEVKINEVNINLREDHIKTILAIFISEVISKTIREESSNEELFQFLKSSIITLNNQEVGFSNFHLVFLIKLSAYIGFFPASSHQLLELCNDNTFSTHEKNVLDVFIKAEYDHDIAIDYYLRKKILNVLLSFYYHNMENLGAINSSKVLSEVLMG